MRTLITGGTILTPDKALIDHVLVIDGERIAGFAPRYAFREDHGATLDARGFVVAPGLIDVHVHGAAGVDTMDATPQAFHRMSQFLAQHGVTSYLPTTMTASPADIRAVIDVFPHTLTWTDGAQPLGLHPEGPYLSHDYRGAQPRQHLRVPDPDEYTFWLESDRIKLITVAPEVPGVLALVEAGVSRGIGFAAGHSGASYEQTETAVDRGLRQITHTFNGMPSLHHRAPGLIGAALTDDRLRTQIIADGVHVHPAVVKLLVCAKGVERSLLITDAIRATGLTDGEYRLGDQIVHVRNHIAQTDSGSLAGSTLTLDQGLRNVMQFAGLSLAEALPMATRVPAEALGLADRKGVLVPGAAADLIFLDASHEVRLTMIAGEVVFSNLGGDGERTGARKQMAE